MKPSSAGCWLAISILIQPILAQAQTPEWSQFENAPIGTTPRFDDLSFLNESTGYVARATGGIHKTIDGGKTFYLSRSSTVPYPGTNLTAHFRSIAFVTDQHGFAGNLGPGSYDGTVSDTNILFETWDGGTNWLVKPGFPETGMKGLCSIQVLDAQHIYGGGRVRGPAYFIKSADGGTNWTVTNLTAAGVLGGIMDVYFRDTTNGFLVGMDTNAYTTNCVPPYYHGAIARTTNGGATWQVVATNGINCAYFWKMSWPSPNIGYVSLQQNYMSPGGNHVVYKTTDGGATWTSNGVPFAAIGVSTFYSQGIGFVTTNEGWVGGDSAGGLNNFLHTTDGGATWTPVGSADTLRINRIRFLRPDYAVASGARVAVFRVPLEITSQPTNITAAVGSNVTFFVSAQGSTALTYQWRFNGANIAGATNTAHSITNVQQSHVGNYDVTVTDISGTEFSDVATLTVSTGVPPFIVVQPRGLTVNVGSNATFSVAAIGSPPLSYQWQFNGTNIAGATQTNYTRFNAQLGDSGNYSVLVTNSAGSAASAVASLYFVYDDNFDAYASQTIVTNGGTTNGYKIFFNAAFGVTDFKAIFGFDYSSVTFPTNIVSAPHSTGGTTRGLYLTVNKDTNGQLSAVNLYPLGQFSRGNFALKFDLWLNYANPGTSTEHALFGINHSASVTNRIGLATSDGLFFAISADGNVSATGTTARDFSVFRGGGAGAIPFLMLTNNTTFGPTPLLGPQFDNSNPGFTALFPSKTFGSITTLAGSPGLRWVSVELRQVNNLVTCLLDGTAIVQYTNTASYTNGTVMIGYNDHFASIGDTNSFAIFDNIRVEDFAVAPVQLLAQRAGSELNLSFATTAYEPYTVQWTTNLASPVWMSFTNLVGNGSTNTLFIPLTGQQRFFRVSRP